jgi:hypothetical protein
MRKRLAVRRFGSTEQRRLEIAAAASEHRPTTVSGSEAVTDR